MEYTHVCTLTGHTHWVNCVDLFTSCSSTINNSNNNNDDNSEHATNNSNNINCTVTSCSWDKTVRLWTVPIGDLAHNDSSCDIPNTTSLKGHTSRVRTCCFNGDGMDSMMLKGDL